MQIKPILAFFVAINKIKQAFASGNVFTSPMGDTTIHAGQTMEITWVELAGDKVNINLMKGDPNDLQPVTTIVLDSENQGELPWTVSADIPPGQYSMQIISDNGNTNYSPFFTIYDAVTPLKKGYDQETSSSGKKKKSNNRKWGIF